MLFFIHLYFLFYFKLKLFYCKNTENIEVNKTFKLNKCIEYVV